jgi:plasmid stabilization system protein ParE
MLPPIPHWMPRVRQDIEDCLDFVRRQPWGKAEDRERDIRCAIQNACAHPEENRPEHYLPDTRLWLRRCKAAQFVIVYAYLQPRDLSSPGVVSIRAVRHIQVANVFDGVREPAPKPYQDEPSGSRGKLMETE